MSYTIASPRRRLAVLLLVMPLAACAQVAEKPRPAAAGLAKPQGVFVPRDQASELRPAIVLAPPSGETAPPDAAAQAAEREQLRQRFTAWILEFRAEARQRGISEATLAAALDGLEPSEKVIELDRRQPEFVDTFWNYLDRRVTDPRVEQGRKLMKEHADLLAALEKRYDVPAAVLVAFWGLETSYGAVLGSHRVPQALATLAFEGRRGGFFRQQLLEALAILDAGHIPPAGMLGSWAGAMGQMQFMPGTFQRFAVDADGDNRKDLWNSLPDALASGANYLNKLGWKRDERWGREVLLPEGFDYGLAGLLSPSSRRTVNEWAALGVRQADGKPLPRASLPAALLLPQGHQGPAFLVYRNFDAILDWNRSVHYALAVGHLSDRLLGQPPLLTGRNADSQRLTRDEAMEIQLRLGQMGLDAGEPDGVLGSRTRTAIRDYQARHGLAADGYASPSLLAHLRGQTPPPAGAGQPAPSTPQVAVH